MSECTCCCIVFFFKQKTAYEMRISDWSSDVCSSDLRLVQPHVHLRRIPHLVSRATQLGSQFLARGEAAVQAEQLQQVDDGRAPEIGRASCRERVCQYV